MDVGRSCSDKLGIKIIFASYGWLEKVSKRLDAVERVMWVSSSRELVLTDLVIQIYSSSIMNHRMPLVQIAPLMQPTQTGESHATKGN